jgi:hypothetical protein
MWEAICLSNYIVLLLCLLSKTITEIKPTQNYIDTQCIQFMECLSFCVQLKYSMVFGQNIELNTSQFDLKKYDPIIINNFSNIAGK